MFKIASFTHYEDTDDTGDEVTQVGLVNVAEDVDPGDDDCAVALVTWNLETQQVFSLNGQNREGGSGGETVEHGGRKVD